MVNMPSGGRIRSSSYLRAAPLVTIVLVGTVVLWFRHNASPGQMGKTFPFDLIFYYYPMTEYAAERLSQGELPLWNPYPCCGVPFLATAQVGVFYPLTLLSVLMPVDAAFKVRMFSEVLLGGLFAAMFFRSLGVGSYSAGIGGMLYVFACLLGQTFWPPQVSTLVWLPFLLLCAERFIQRGDVKWWTGFVLGTALQLLAGFPQFVVYTFYVVPPYVLLRLIQRWLGSECLTSQVGRRMAALGAGCLLGTGLAGVQLLPTLELTQNTMRSKALTPQHVHYLEQGMERKLPNTWQALRNSLDPKPRLISFDTSPDAVYLGIPTLVLVLVAVICRRGDPVLWFFLVVSAISFLLSFGHHGWTGPLYRIYEHLPTGMMFRTPSRFRLLTYFGLITVAVLGLEEFRTGLPGLRGHWWVFLVVVTGALALIAAMVVYSSPLAPALAAITAAALAVSWWRPRTAPGPMAAHTLLLGFLLLDLAHATAPHGSLRDVPVYYGQRLRFMNPVNAVVDRSLIEEAGLDRLHLHLSIPAKPLRPVPRFFAVTDYEPLIPERWRRANEAMNGNALCTMWDVEPNMFGPFYDLASVKCMVVPRLANSAGVTTGVAASLPDGTANEPLIVIRRPTAVPRAYLSGTYRTCSAQEALSKITHPDYPYRTTVLLEKDPGMRHTSALADDDAADIISYAAERVILSTHSRQERLLVLTDTWFPGWKAFVDGTETEILRANYLFRAVRVPAGRHQVVFEYKPLSLTLGAVLSCVSAAVLFGVNGLLTRRRSRKGHPR